MSEQQARLEQEARIEALVTDLLDVVVAHRVNVYETEVAIGEIVAEFFAVTTASDTRLEQWVTAVQTRVAQMKAARVERVM